MEDNNKVTRYYITYRVVKKSILDDRAGCRSAAHYYHTRSYNRVLVPQSQSDRIIFRENIRGQNIFPNFVLCLCEICYSSNI